MKDGENIAIREKVTMIQLPVKAFWLLIIPMNQRERILFWDVAFFIFEYVGQKTK